MAGNKNLGKAKDAKQDEFYTQLADIEEEMRHHRKQFKGKVIFCNCDDPYESNFFRYFALNFNYLGLKKLIATCYVDSPVAGTQLSLFDTTENADTVKKPHKIEINEVDDYTGDGAVDMADVEWLIRNDKNVLTELEGDGDFRSEECVALLNEADIVVTNPPFSLFPEYIAQLMEHEKQFLVIGNQNALTYKEVFKHVQNNELWWSGGKCIRWFLVPEDYEGKTKLNDDGQRIAEGARSRWYTNLDSPLRHTPMDLFRSYNLNEYHHYDNFNAIEVAETDKIPCDFEGLMGVPITFLDKYDPEQFEIVGTTDIPETLDGVKELGQEWIDKYRANGGRGHYTAHMKSVGYSGDGKVRVIFSRLIIRNKNPEEPLGA